MQVREGHELKSKYDGARNFIKKRLDHCCISVNFAKSLPTHFFNEHLRVTASDKLYCPSEL